MTGASARCRKRLARWPASDKIDVSKVAFTHLLKPGLDVDLLDRIYLPELRTELSVAQHGAGAGVDFDKRLVFKARSVHAKGHTSATSKQLNRAKGTTLGLDRRKGHLDLPGRVFQPQRRRLRLGP